jgi:uncharacterized protein (TIGR03437 family)
MFILKRLLFGAVFAGSLGLTLQAQPVITTGGTVNAADYSRDFAPGAIISIFGTNLASTTGGARSVPLPTTLGDGTSVELVNGGNVQSLPLFYVSPGQINAELPYGLTASTVQLRVRTATGVSATDSLTIKPRAPKLFTVDLSGTGNVIATDPGFSVATQSSPVKPGDNIILWMNSLGETNPPVVAGNSAPGGPASSPATIADPVTVTIGGKAATVTFAGAAPAYSGLYQVNVKAPFAAVTGPLNIQVTLGGVTTQAAITVPYRQLGFYDTVLGGKPVSGQAVNGLNALAFRQSDGVTWGQTGFNQWTAPLPPSPISSTVSGEAATLKNGAGTVFDNNGIEDASGATFYSNAGGGADNQKPGLVNLYSMSNYFPLIFSTYMKFSQPVTISEIIGYFDPNGSQQLPFDPNNPYLKYRMNIWSNASGMPKETGGFTGDVFSSDSSAGAFTVSKTGVSRVSSNSASAPEPIWRLDYKLNSPVTIPAGEYWFSHDASVRDTPVTGSNSAASVTPAELADIVRPQPQPGQAVRFSFFGREMMYQESWVLPFALEIRPVSPISTKEFQPLETAR